MKQELAVLIFKPKDEYFAEICSELKFMIEETRSFPGCIYAAFFLCEKHKEIIIQHKWKNRKAQDNYLSWRAERGDLIRLSERLLDEPFFRSYKEVI